MPVIRDDFGHFFLRCDAQLGAHLNGHQLGAASGVWIDLTASSAVNLPINSASLRSDVILIGLRSIRCTYLGLWVPPRFTFTTNFVFFIVFSLFLLYADERPSISECAYLDPHQLAFTRGGGEQYTLK